jgi:hypothetical protein
MIFLKGLPILRLSVVIYTKDNSFKLTRNNQNEKHNAQDGH